MNSGLGHEGLGVGKFGLDLILCVWTRDSGFDNFRATLVCKAVQ